MKYAHLASLLGALLASNAYAQSAAPAAAPAAAPSAAPAAAPSAAPAVGPVAAPGTSAPLAPANAGQTPAAGPVAAPGNSVPTNTTAPIAMNPTNGAQPPANLTPQPAPQPATPRTNFGTQQSSLGQRQAATGNTAAANPAAENAQLNQSPSAQNLARQGGLGASRDNATFALDRQAVEFAGAPESAAPGTQRNGVAFGAPATTAGTQNPANRGPTPGQDFTTPTTTGAGNATTTNAQPAPVIATGVVQPAQVPSQVTVRATTQGTAQPGTRTPAQAGAQANKPEKKETRVLSYGPRGGNNTVGLARYYELEGNFRYSRPGEAEKKKRAKQRTASRD